MITFESDSYQKSYCDYSDDGHYPVENSVHESFFEHVVPEHEREIIKSNPFRCFQPIPLSEAYIECPYDWNQLETEEKNEEWTYEKIWNPMFLQCLQYFH